jgi:hypothetical protein
MAYSFCLSLPVVDPASPVLELVPLPVKARLLLGQRLMGLELLDSELLVGQTNASFLN